MAKEPQADRQDQAEDFAREAEEQNDNILIEFWDFLLYNKKWWLIPIIVMLLFIGAIVLLSGTSIAPFLYTLW